jgi:transaldolase
MAAGELGCQSATISHTVLAELAKLPYDESKQPGVGKPKPKYAYLNAEPLSARFEKLTKLDPLTVADWDGNLASTETDYLTNNGSELQKAIAADLVTQQRLNDALDLFKGGDARSRVKIEAAMNALKA